MRKQILLLLSLFINTILSAQTPQQLSYQSVIRNASGALVSNTSVGIRISILQGSATGTPVYQEIQTVTTNAYGLATLQIGSITPLIGINWAVGPYFLKTETDPAGGANYTINGTTQLLSVPYAFYAETSGNSTPGPQGPQGIQGPAGASGLNGADGVGIVSTVDNGNGTFTLNYSDGSSFTTTDLTGPQGPQGATGLTGAVGPQGPQGVQGPTGAIGPQGIQGIPGPSIMNIQNTSLSFTTSVNSTVRNNYVLSSESLTIPENGYYMLIYTGRGDNWTEVTGIGVNYDLSGVTGLVKTSNPNVLLNDQFVATFIPYHWSHPTLYNVYDNAPCSHNLTVITYLNAGDQIAIATRVNSATPAPTGQWNVYPQRLEAVKLRD